MKVGVVIMLGKELIEYIKQHGLEENEVFVSCQGYFGSLENVQQINSNLVVADTEVDVDEYIMKTYFSKWFELISFEEAEELYNDGDRNVLLLTPDGTDRYIEGYTLDELRQENNNGCWFGLEK
jgi:hypothetical protein